LIIEERFMVGTSPLYVNKIVELAARYKIPTIYPRRDYVEPGGLVSYAADYDDVFRQAGIYTGRILKGEKPAQCCPARGRSYYDRFQMVRRDPADTASQVI
jgi:ABC-type uncharacterized transport system substrate-binding protein